MSKARTSSRPKLSLLEAKGDHYQIGLALGRAAAPALRDVVPRIGRYRELKQSARALRGLGALESAARDAFPGLMREVDGIADGSGMDFQDVWMWNCRGDFSGGGDQTRTSLTGCTTVLLAGGDGRPAIIGHNEDDQSELDGRCFLARMVPDDGPAFLSFYSPGLLPGHTFAVNDAGLVQTINHVRPYDQRPGVPRHVIARAVLSRSTLQGAIDLLKRRDRASGFHHSLGICGDSKLYSVEAPASGCVVKTVSDQPSAHTNHLICDQFANLEQELARSSCDRLERAQRLIEGEAPAARNPLAILQDSGGDGLPICRKGQVPEDPGYTLATAIFAIDTAGVDWRIFTDSISEAEHAGRVSVS